MPDIWRNVYIKDVVERNGIARHGENQAHADSSNGKENLMHHDYGMATTRRTFLGVAAALTASICFATGVEETPGFSRGVLTVPTSAASGLREKLSVSSPWKGYRVLLGASAEGDMTIFTAKVQTAGCTIIFR